MKHSFTPPSGCTWNVHPGLAWSRTAQRNVPRCVHGELRGKTTRQSSSSWPRSTAVVAGKPDRPFHSRSAMGSDGRQRQGSSACSMPGRSGIAPNASVSRSLFTPDSPEATRSRTGDRHHVSLPFTKRGSERRPEPLKNRASSRRVFPDPGVTPGRDHARIELQSRRPKASTNSMATRCQHARPSGTPDALGNGA